MIVAVTFARAIGENLRHFHEASGLVPEALAARSRLTPTEIVRAESGDADLTARDLFKLASVLETSPNALGAGIHWDESEMRFEIRPPR